MLRLLDLFSGVGGFSLGLERTRGFRAVAFCEIAPAPRRTLALQWPGVPCYADIKDVTAAQLAADGIAVDAICGGFPCQDVSLGGAAYGLGVGLAGERSGLWREYFRLIRELRPFVVIVENVAALLGRGIGRVLGDLASIRYDAEWRCIPGRGVGAPHERDRVWIVAYPGGSRLARPVLERGSFPIPDASQIARLGDQTVRVGNWWAGNPPPDCMGDGISPELVRSALHGLGNAVIPQIAELIGVSVLRARSLAQYPAHQVLQP